MIEGGEPKPGGSAGLQGKKRMALLCICCLIFAGNIAAQSRSVMMPSRETTLKQALSELQRQTGLAAVINYGDIAPDRKVTLTSENLSAEDLLHQVLSGTGFTYEMTGRHILVVPEPAKTEDDGEGAVSAIWREEVDRSALMETMTFRTGSTTLEAWFMNNADVFKKLDRSLTDTAVLERLDHISVTAASSPDGNTANNEKLALARAQHTKGYFERKYPHIAPEKIIPFSVGEEWSGLRRLVAEDLRTPDRAEVLALLDNVPDEYMRDTLRTIGGGRAWRYITAELFPRLRGAVAVTLHFWDSAAERRIDTVSVSGGIGAGTGVQRVEIVAAKPKPISIETPPPVRLPDPRPLFAVKTNLLADAASAVNLEIEVPIGARWSFALEGVFPWWMFTGGTLEGRYWFGDRTARPVLTGWFAGIYAGGGSYDLNWNSRAREGDFFHAGLSGGYAHTVNRSGSLRMEYSLGVGRLWGTRHILDEASREKYGYFGPTRAKVSLVWMLERK